MSTSVSLKSVLVIADSGSPTISVAIFDSNLNLVARSGGRLEAHLSPGIYKVRYSTPTAKLDRLFEVEANQPEFAIDAPADLMQFGADSTSAALRTHLVESCAGSGRKEPPAGLKSSCFLLVFDAVINDVTRLETPLPATEVPRAAGEKLQLLRADGSLVADFAADAPRLHSSGLRFDLDAGEYLLRLQLANGTALEQTVVTCLGWQTQVFLPRERVLPDSFHAVRAELSGSITLPSPQRANPVANLENATILMAPLGRETDLDVESIAAVEMARGWLARSEPVAPISELRRVLQGESFPRQGVGVLENPMLGIFGAHLLTLTPDPDRALLASVIERLKRIVGEHPDIAAIELWLNPSATVRPFRVPPMLRNSWRIILDLPNRSNELIPNDSFSGRVADRLWGAKTWLVWSKPEAQRSRLAVPRIKVFSLLTDYVRQAITLSTTSQFATREAVQRNLTPAEASVLFYVSSVIEGQKATSALEEKIRPLNWLGPLNSSIRRILPSSLHRSAAQAARTYLDLDQLSVNTGLPAATLRRATDGLFAKVGFSAAYHAFANDRGSANRYMSIVVTALFLGLSLPIQLLLFGTLVHWWSTASIAGIVNMFVTLLETAGLAILGSFVSVQERLMDRGVNLRRLQMYLSMENRLSVAVMSPLSAVCFAVILYLTLASHVIGGSFFHFVNGAPADGWSRAALLGLGFVSGFAERFVPDSLVRIAKAALTTVDEHWSSNTPTYGVPTLRVTTSNDDATSKATADLSTVEEPLMQGADALARAAFAAHNDGDVEREVELATEVVNIRRRLNDLAPTKHGAKYAAALNNLSIALAASERYVDAYEAVGKAVDIYRTLAKTSNDYLAPLALSLNTLAQVSDEVQKPNEALSAIREAVATARFLIERGIGGYDFVLAKSLQNLSNRLELSDERTEALAAIREAVAIFSALALEAPSQYTGALAEAMSNLAISRMLAGEHTEAVTDALEAVRMLRELVAESAVCEDDLAIALSTLAKCFDAAGRHREAVGPIVESVEIRRRLVDEGETRYARALVLDLNGLGNQFGHVGLREQALSALEEARSRLMDLAYSRIDVANADLAMTENNLALAQLSLGQRESALVASEHAASLYEELAKDEFEHYGRDFAMSLNNKSIVFAACGRESDALDAALKATDAYRSLAASEPSAYAAELATSLNNLANRLSEAGRNVEALELMRETITMRRALASSEPDAHEPDVAANLNNLSVVLGDLGQWAEALSAAEEAVYVYRRIARVQPEAYEPDLAASLNSLSIALAALGRHRDALSAIDEAIPIRRKLAYRQPASFESDLAASLNNRANRLAALGQREQALETSENAEAIYSRLAANEPLAFRRVLSTTQSNHRKLTLISSGGSSVVLARGLVDISSRLAIAA